MLRSRPEDTYDLAIGLIEIVNVLDVTEDDGEVARSNWLKIKFCKNIIVSFEILL